MNSISLKLLEYKTTVRIEDPHKFSFGPYNINCPVPLLTCDSPNNVKKKIFLSLIKIEFRAVKKITLICLNVNPGRRQ